MSGNVAGGVSHVAEEAPGEGQRARVGDLTPEGRRGWE